MATVYIRSTRRSGPPPLPPAFFVVLAVQFISTIADNAFLIVAIARLVELAEADWRIPLLKIGFTLFYVVLGPFVGPVSDGFRKGRVMLMANGLKTVAMLLLLAGFDPLLAIVIAGWGASVYAPAKYGLMTELLPPAHLVRANGFFEGATVSAVILGTVLGGVLISPAMPVLPWSENLNLADTAPTALLAGMLALTLLNALSTALCLAIADSGARYTFHSFHPVALVQRFWRENRLLWRDQLGGLSMAVTTLLWGVGATLQLLVLRWAQEALGLPLEQAAYLQGITAVGVVGGAMLASHLVSIDNTVRVLPLGVLLGLMIPLMLCVDSVPMACFLLVVVGGFAGFFVVPMNALLQHRGYMLLTAGRSIAVQGFNENAGMLFMLAVYAGAIAVDVSLRALVLSFGVLVAGGMALVVAAYRLQCTRSCAT
ncbi:MAG: lysophospholipid transporter LplT [Burkholderiales bacterium]|nr:lysophospholipid transporter LplT [Burkholderiales bacterium]